MAYTTITDPSAYFQTKLYTGNGSQGHAITNDGNSDLQPDWLWIKQRNSAKNHNVYDSTRGVTKQLRTNLANAEATNTTDDQIVSLNLDGFTLGDDTDSVGVNENSQTYAAWQWKANGGTTASNTDGSITSTVQANTTAGFSIISYTGTGSNATVGHGLGTTPSMVIYKILDVGTSWAVWHKNLATPTTGLLELNSTGAELNSTSYWNSTLPNSTVLSIGTYGGVNSNNPFIAYCFTEKQGYSSFGSYTGNGSADGPFIYTGFKPAWIMVRRTDSTGSWLLWDTKRTPNNVTGTVLYANDASAEETFSSYNLDFLSNGFKIRGTDVYTNASNGSYIYMAFAENPLVATNGVPTTAR